MLKKVALAVIAVLVVAIAGFIIWGSTPLQATPEAQAALQSTAAVRIETVQGWTVFRPLGQAPQTGFIFYPGGRVDYRAYAPLLRPIAEQGYLVVLPPMPLSLAIFGVDQAGQIIAAFPEIKHWAIGGHSLGGSMAAQYAGSHPGQVAGLVFWASYPAGDMHDAAIQVASISASQDGLATPEKIEASRKNLPAGTTYTVIDGGCHAQFGSYGLQPGDGTPSIAPQVQWQQTVQATLALLQSISR